MAPNRAACEAEKGLSGAREATLGLLLTLISRRTKCKCMQILAAAQIRVGEQRHGRTTDGAVRPDPASSAYPNDERDIISTHTPDRGRS